MKPLLLFLAMVLTPTALVFAWIWADSLLEERAEARRRAEQDREADAEWFALLAAPEATKAYDQVACEQMERAEGWTS